MEYIEIVNDKLAGKTLCMEGLLHSGEAIFLKSGEKCRYHHKDFKFLFPTLSLKLFTLANIKWTSETKLRRKFTQEDIYSEKNILIYKGER